MIVLWISGRLEGLCSVYLTCFVENLPSVSHFYSNCLSMSHLQHFFGVGNPSEDRFSPEKFGLIYFNLV